MGNTYTDASKKWYENNKEVQKERNREYAEKNKEHVNYLRSRSAARSFIRTKATQEDLEELKKLIKEREMQLYK